MVSGDALGYVEVADTVIRNVGVMLERWRETGWPRMPRGIGRQRERLEDCGVRASVSRTPAQ